MHPPDHHLGLGPRLSLALLPLALGLALLGPSPAAAAAGDDPPKPPDLSAPPPSGAPSLPPAALEFDLLGPDAAATSPVDAGFARKVERRRTMLKLHQGLGIATWASLAATTVVGQLQFNDRFRGGGDTGKYRTPHRALVATSATLFTATGLLGVLAPEPYARREGRLDTATVHEASMAVATAGMVAEVILGIAARGKAGSVRERDLAVAHQVIGYSTFGAMTVGAAVLVF